MPERTLYLEFADRSVPVEIRGESTERSKHTGAELRVITGRVRTSEEEMDEWFRNVVKSEGQQGVWSQRTPVQERWWWKVHLGTYSVSNGRYSYEVTMREPEDLQVDPLLLGDLELTPYEYSERFEGEFLMVDAKVLVSSEQRDRLEKMLDMGGYLPVVRKGISDEPKQMRFGMCSWSEHDEGTKYGLLLVDQRYDEGKRKPHIVSVEQGNIRQSLAYQMALTSGMLDLLVSKQVISEEEATQVRDTANDELQQWRRRFWRVRDVDALE